METVVIRTTQKDDDSNRFTLLEQVIEEAGFWDILEKQLIRSGKTKKDMSVITEPALVEHLINRITEKESIANVLGYLTSQMDPAFPMKGKNHYGPPMRGAFAWLIRTISRLE